MRAAWAAAVIGVIAGCDDAPNVMTAIDAGARDAGPPPPPTGCDPWLFESVADGGDDDPGATYDYVINTVTIDANDDPYLPPPTHGSSGFDLDRRSSPTRPGSQTTSDCAHGDYFSTLDPDQNEGDCAEGMPYGGTDCHGGVDNQLPSLVAVVKQFRRGTSIRTLIANAIARGAWAIPVRVVGVNGTLGPTLNDRHVRVQVFGFAWPAFSDCGAVQSPRQRYVVATRSLGNASDLATPVIDMPGCIVGGRVRTERIVPSALAPVILLPQYNDTAPVPFHVLALRADLSYNGATNGNAGGVFTQDELFATNPFPPIFWAHDARPLFQGFVDIATPDVFGALSCDYPNGLISAGFGFTMLRAVIDPTPASAPPAGACGSGN